MTVYPRNRRQVSSSASSPIILDTDIGGDPDDAITVTCAARVPELAAVLAADEVGGERARFTRHQLDLLGRTEVPVTAGADLGNTEYWIVDGITPDAVLWHPMMCWARCGRCARRLPVRFGGSGAGR